MRSMTGYGRGRAPLGGGELVLEVRAVNHRFLDVKPRFPASMAAGAAAAEERVRARLGRGRVEIACRTEGPVGGELRLDQARARTAFESLSALRDAVVPDQEVPLTLLSAVPGLFSSSELDSTDVATAARCATDGACNALEEMREREGDALRRDLDGRVGRVRELAAQIEASSEGVRRDLRARVLARIEELLQASGTTVDNGRLEHEIAIQADRSDISEELTRLQSHCDQFAGLLDEGGEPVGRRLEFLLQEMGREVNTTGAKVSDLALTRHVLELKTELERLREQVQNVL